MNIGLVRAGVKASGGFERVLARAASVLRQAGHDVTDLLTSGSSSNRLFGASLSPMVEQQSHFFEYMRMMEAFTSLDTYSYYLIISAHPPSFAVHHPRHLSIFMHHQRTFYDAAEVWETAGFEPLEIHRAAVETVRRADQVLLDDVSYFLAGSREVANRLGRFNSISENVGIIRCGPGLEPYIDPGIPGATVLCVSRQTFLKRTELFVHGLSYLPHVEAILAGDGDRLPWVRHLASRLLGEDLPTDPLTAEDIWMNRGVVPEGYPPGPCDQRLQILGRVSDALLNGLYLRARCVVAPAFGEDYGLTAVEALAFGRPLIVCTDGGCLTEFVVDGVNGYVVEPSGEAIAEAVDHLVDNPALAAEMGRKGRELFASYTWEQADATLLSAVQELV